MPKQDDYVRITLRLPPELHDALKAASGARSLNAEIVDRLEHTVAIEKKSGDYKQAAVYIGDKEYSAPEVAALIDFQTLGMMAVKAIQKSNEELEGRVEALEDELRQRSGYRQTRRAPKEDT